MGKSGGFTLIELLVVIAIIALLMAILMPVLNRANKQAREAVCLSNLKQWGTAAAMYSTEYEGKMWAIPSRRGEWMELMRPYYADSAFTHALPNYTDPIPPNPLRVVSDIPANAGGRQIWRFCIDRHSGGINVCFLDSSVRKTPIYVLWDLKWHRNWEPQHYQFRRHSLVTLT